MASVHRVYGRPEDVRHGLFIPGQRQLRTYGEQELADTQTRRTRRAVVLYVEVVRQLRPLQLPLCNQ